MQITPVTIPATSDIDKLRDSIMIALNRMVGQINRAESIEDRGLNAFEVSGIVRDAKNELYNAPVHGSKLKDGTVNIAQFASTIRPVLLRATNPTLPDALYPPGTIMYNTTSYTLYKVDLAGTAWIKMINGGTDIQAGTITAAEILANTITAGQIAAGAIGTTELYAGEILVGGGDGKPARFGVVDSGGNAIGFIGDDDAGYQGAYFKNLKVGPTFAAPVITASATGVEINGAKLVVGASSIGVTTTIDPAAAGQAIRIASGTSPYPGINIGTIESGIPIIELYGALSTLTPYTIVSPTIIKTRYGASTPLCSFEVGSASAEMFTYASSSHYVNILCNASSGKINMHGGSYQIDGADVINSSSQFVGAGSVHTGHPVVASGFNPYVGGVQYTGATGSIYATLIRTNSGALEYWDGDSWEAVGVNGIALFSAIDTGTTALNYKGGVIV